MGGNSAVILMLTANNRYLATNLFFLFVLLVITLIFIILLNKQGHSKILILLLIYHTCMSVTYYFVQPWPPYDTATYYISSQAGTSINDFFNVGGDYVCLLLYPLVKYIHLSFFSGFMLFNVIGFIGLLFFYITLRPLINHNDKAIKLLNIVIFMPGISLWTGSISKESINFLGLTLILYALTKINKRIVYFLLGSVFIILIRPQLYMVVLLALILTIVLLAKTSVMQKLVVAVIFSALIIPAYNMTLERTKLEKLNLETTESYLEQRGVNWGGGSGIDIQNYNAFFKMFSYLYRPLFIDVHSFNMALASFENLFYLIITLQMCSLKFVKFMKNQKDLFLSFNLLYFLIAAFLLSQSEGNLGTASRHKILIMPSLLALSLLYRARKPVALPPAANAAAVKDS